jgi:hypothetical protein
VAPLEGGVVSSREALCVAEYDFGKALAESRRAGPFLVFLDNLAESYDLGVCEAGEVADVLAAAEQLALVLCEAALAAEVGGRVGGGFGGLCDPAADVVVYVVEPAADLVCLAGDEEIYAVVLALQLEEQAVLELGEGGVLVAGDGDGGGLVACGVDLDFMLDGVVVEVICRACL